MGSLEYGTDPARVAAVAQQVADVRDQGVEVAIVVGAGNIFRGMKGAAAGMDRSTADYMGMLATLLNALPLQDALEKIGTDTRVQSALGGLRGGRALSAPPRDAPPREGPRRDLRGRHRQPVLHDRHRGGAAGRRDPRGDHPDGQERGGGRLQRRPGARPERGVHPRNHAHGGDRAAPAGDGLDRAGALHGERDAAERLQHGRRHQPGADNLRRARGHPRLDTLQERPSGSREPDRRTAQGRRRADGQIPGVRPARVLDGPHGPREPVAAGADRRRLLRRPDPPEPALDGLRAGGAAADGAAV